MKNVNNVMTPDVVWVSPAAPVRTAIILLKGYGVSALPVVASDDTIVGMVTNNQLLGEHEDASVSEVMTREFVTCEPNISVVEAAEIMQNANTTHLIVSKNGKLAGMLSGSDLISELGKTYDPLTGLPWSDTFREWALNALKHGVEISVILFDLDQFGMFNKRYGHVVGDNVLKSIAEVLKSAVDTKVDCVCRYGGDEFGIVSARGADDAIALAEAIKATIANIRIPNVKEPVTATYGIFGGRRTKERDDTHYEATIDDLVTRASKECMAKKPKPVAQSSRERQDLPAGDTVVTNPLRPVAGQTVPAIAKNADQLGSDMPKLIAVSVASSEKGMTAAATVAFGRLVLHGESSSSAEGGTPIRLAAYATANAVSEALGGSDVISVDDVWVNSTGRNDEIVTAMVVTSSPTSTRFHPASSMVRRGDQIRAAGLAVLAALSSQPDLLRRLAETELAE